MKTRTIPLILISCLILPVLHAGTEITEERRAPVRERVIPYGKVDHCIFGDDEICSPWSEYTVSRDENLVPGQVLYDPASGRPFRVPPEDMDQDD